MFFNNKKLYAVFTFYFSNFVCLLAFSVYKKASLDFIDFVLVTFSQKKTTPCTYLNATNFLFCK